MPTAREPDRQALIYEVFSFDSEGKGIQENRQQGPEINN